MAKVSFLGVVSICIGLAACNPPVDTVKLTAVPAPALHRTSIDTSGSMPKGFIYAEAATLVELCTDINNPDARPAADTTGWTQVWPAPGAPLELFGNWQNAWKLWKKTDQPNTYAVAIRGTVENERSIEEDVVATSISAHPAVNAWRDSHVAFTLAETEGAETHLGFTYALAYLMFTTDHGILAELKANVPKGARIYITGHSQGAAVATLAHAFLHYAINDPTDQYLIRNQDYSLKSYVFAQPKPGNWQFAMDFAQIAGQHQTAFVINNSRDWVPQVPLTLEFIDEPQTDLVGQLGSGLATTLLVDLQRMAQQPRSVLSLQAETVFARQLQAWNWPVSRMDYRVAGPADASSRAISVNYVTVGNLVPVFGPKPSAPEVPKNDWLYQHHLTTYRTLVQAQLNPAGLAQ